jgi:hypothetical protein
MTARFGAACAAVVVLSLLRSQAAPMWNDLNDDPFAWLNPAVTVDAAMRGRLDKGDVVSRVLPSTDGAIGVFAAARLEAESGRLAAWGNAIADLKQSRYVLAIQRFSDPPVLADLDALALDETDLESARACAPGVCSLKIGVDEIRSLRQAADDTPADDDGLQREFRRIIFNRVNAYATDGLAGLAPYADRRKPNDPTAVFASLLAVSPYLRTAPITDLSARTAAFFYWSKEHYGTGKPVIAVTHVDIVRADAPSTIRVAIIAKEIYASHYRNGSIGVTAVVEGATDNRYLVYVNRSQLDVFGGLFGGLKRSIVEGRLKSESVKVLEQVRRRLDNEPPSNTGVRHPAVGTGL